MDKVSAGDLTKGQIVIKNKYQFIDLKGFTALWTLSENGVESFTWRYNSS